MEPAAAAEGPAFPRKTVMLTDDSTVILYSQKSKYYELISVVLNHLPNFTFPCPCSCKKEKKNYSHPSLKTKRITMSNRNKWFDRIFG